MPSTLDAPKGDVQKLATRNPGSTHQFEGKVVYVGLSYDLRLFQIHPRWLFGISSSNRFIGFGLLIGTGMPCVS